MPGQRCYLAFSEVQYFTSARAAHTVLIHATGSKNWPLPITNRIWDWVLARMDKIFAQIKPDTVITWETLISVCPLSRSYSATPWLTRISPQFQLSDCDPRRHGRLIQWILDLPLEFNGDSAFQSKQSEVQLGFRTLM